MCDARLMLLSDLIKDITFSDKGIQMATHHWTLEEFVDRNEDWTSYCEQLDQYFIVNDLSDTSKPRAILLSSCGKPTYSLLHSLVSPA